MFLNVFKTEGRPIVIQILLYLRTVAEAPQLKAVVSITSSMRSQLLFVKLFLKEDVIMYSSLCSWMWKST